MEPSETNSLGDKLRELRFHKKWTLNELSKRSGLSISHISSLERGTRTKPSMEVVRKLANALQVPVHHLHDDGFGDPSLYTEVDMILSRFAPDTQAFLLNEESIPFILFAKRLYELQNSEYGVIQALAEFMENQHKSQATDPKPESEEPVDEADKTETADEQTESSVE